VSSTLVSHVTFTQGLAVGLTEPAAVVCTVIVVDAVPGAARVPAASVTDGGAKMQVAPAGRPVGEHAKATVPEKPLTEVTVRVVLPDFPGLETVTAGFVDET
jgi:hypothetical protein